MSSLSPDVFDNDPAGTVNPRGPSFNYRTLSAALRATGWRVHANDQLLHLRFHRKAKRMARRPHGWPLHRRLLFRVPQHHRDVR